jgi:hypothetical protein
VVGVLPHLFDGPSALSRNAHLLFDLAEEAAVVAEPS